jgi:hypothetical protein
MILLDRHPFHDQARNQVFWIGLLVVSRGTDTDRGQAEQ